MAILMTNGSLFFHIPRTGGNWVTMALEGLGLYERRVEHKHASLKAFYAQQLLEASPFMFCFVRHPLAWYKSWFRYSTRMNWPDYPASHPSSPLNGLGSSDEMSFIGKQEHLADGLLYVLGEMNLEVDESLVRGLERVNGSPEMSIEWDEGLRERLIECESEAMARYVYTH